jgi:sugar O-acyltransferase (sialic acid O-acetyltransferase NeuD family)
MVTGPQPLILIGAGGLAREAAETVRALNSARLTWTLLGYLDDDPAKQETVISGLPVLGSVDDLGKYPDAKVVLCAGRPDNYVARSHLASRVELEADRYATLVHPTASIGSTCEVGAGSVVLAHVTLTADAVVDRHVVIMPQVVLTHDVRVGEFATLASGVRLGGSSRIEPGAYIGSGACVREGLTIGERAMVGMGAVVTRDVPPERLWVGCPARDVARAPLPDAAGAIV